MKEKKRIAETIAVLVIVMTTMLTTILMQKHKVRSWESTRQSSEDENGDVVLRRLPLQDRQ